MKSPIVPDTPPPPPVVEYESTDGPLSPEGSTSPPPDTVTHHRLNTDTNDLSKDMNTNDDNDDDDDETSDEEESDSEEEEGSEEEEESEEEVKVKPAQVLAKTPHQSVTSASIVVVDFIRKALVRLLYTFHPCACIQYTCS